jgi:hypothetical protein
MRWSSLRQYFVTVQARCCPRERIKGTPFCAKRKIPSEIHSTTYEAELTNLLSSSNYVALLKPPFSAGK